MKTYKRYYLIEIDIETRDAGAIQADNLARRLMSKARDLRERDLDTIDNEVDARAVIASMCPVAEKTLRKILRYIHTEKLWIWITDRICN